MEVFIIISLRQRLSFCCIFFGFKRGREAANISSTENVSISDFVILLLPLTPVAQYIIINQDVLSSLESLYVFVYFMIFAGGYVFAFPLLLSVVGSNRTLMILGLAFVFIVTSMASLSQHFAWFESGSFWIQWMSFGGVFLVIWLFYNLKNTKILHLLIVVSFVANSMIQVLAQDNAVDRASRHIVENRFLSLIGNRLPSATPNIYLLIYDAYVSNETMLAYGIDNSAHENT